MKLTNAEGSHGATDGYIGTQLCSGYGPGKEPILEWPIYFVR
jgi:hypothetical protein